MQPVSLDRTNMQLLHIRPYHASYKADGYRYLLLIDDGKAHFVARDNSIFTVNTPLSFIRRELTDGQIVPLADTLLDVVRYGGIIVLLLFLYVCIYITDAYR